MLITSNVVKIDQKIIFNKGLDHWCTWLLFLFLPRLADLVLGSILQREVEGYFVGADWYDDVSRSCPPTPSSPVFTH